jgi:hypothetical protein
LGREGRDAASVCTVEQGFSGPTEVDLEALMGLIRPHVERLGHKSGLVPGQRRGAVALALTWHGCWSGPPANGPWSAPRPADASVSHGVTPRRFRISGQPSSAQLYEHSPLHRTPIALSNYGRACPQHTVAREQLARLCREPQLNRDLPPSCDVE